MMFLYLTAWILLQTTVPVARDISQMANASQDQTVLIYIIIAGYGPVLTALGVIWRKWEDSRNENKKLVSDKETMLIQHSNETRSLMEKNNQTSAQLATILAKLDQKT